MNLSLDHGFRQIPIPGLNNFNETKSLNNL